MSGEARLTKKVKDLEGQLLELSAITNNTVIEGSFSGDGILQAANLLAICQRIYKELSPPEEAKDEAKEAKAERDTVSDAEIKEEPKASNE